MSKDILEILKPGTKCALYARCSTDKQDIDTQEKIATHTADVYQLNIVQCYLDEGVSSIEKRLENRPKLNKLLEDARGNDWDVVLVYKDDRLSRDVVELFRIYSLLSEAGKSIVGVDTQPPRVLNNEDVITKWLLASMSKFEAEKTKDNTYNALLSIARSGNWAGGNPPFGYLYDTKTKTFSIIPEEIYYVKQIFNYYRKGLGCPTIAKKLDPNSRRGKSWNRDAVEAIIKNPFYAGYIKWGKRSSRKNAEIVVTKCKFIEPAVSEEIWRWCTENYHNRGTGQYDPNYFNTSYLFRDKLFCIKCGSVLKPKNQETNNKSSGKRLYRCTSSGCSEVKISAGQTDNLLLQKVREYLEGIDPSLIAKSMKNRKQSEIPALEVTANKLKNGISKYKAKIDEIDRRLTEVWRSSYDEDSKPTMINILNLYRMELKRKISLSEDQLSDISLKIADITRFETNEKYWEPTFEALSKSDKASENTELRQLILGLINKVTISPKSSFNDKSISTSLKAGTMRLEVDSFQLDLTYNFDIGKIRSKIKEYSQIDIFSLFG